MMFIHEPTPSMNKQTFNCTQCNKSYMSTHSQNVERVCVNPHTNIRKFKWANVSMSKDMLQSQIKYANNIYDLVETVMRIAEVAMCLDGDVEIETERTMI